MLMRADRLLKEGIGTPDGVNVCIVVAIDTIHVAHVCVTFICAKAVLYPIIDGVDVVVGVVVVMVVRVLEVLVAVAVVVAVVLLVVNVVVHECVSDVAIVLVGVAHLDIIEGGVCGFR